MKKSEQVKATEKFGKAHKKWQQGPDTRKTKLALRVIFDKTKQFTADLDSVDGYFEDYEEDILAVAYYWGDVWVALLADGNWFCPVPWPGATEHFEKFSDAADQLFDFVCYEL